MSAQKKIYILTDEVFICQNKITAGPMSLEDAKRWVSIYHDKGDALVWCEGFDSWVPLLHFNELTALIPKVPGATIKAGAEKEPKEKKFWEIGFRRETAKKEPPRESHPEKVQSIYSPETEKPQAQPVKEDTVTEATTLLQIGSATHGDGAEETSEPKILPHEVKKVVVALKVDSTPKESTTASGIPAVQKQVPKAVEKTGVTTVTSPSIKSDATVIMSLPSLEPEKTRIATEVENPGPVKAASNVKKKEDFTDRRPMRFLQFALIVTLLGSGAFIYSTLSQALLIMDVKQWSTRVAQTAWIKKWSERLPTDLQKQLSPILSPPSEDSAPAKVATHIPEPQKPTYPVLPTTTRKPASLPPPESVVERAAKTNGARDFRSLSADGRFGKENVPLGISMTQFKKAVKGCKVAASQSKKGFIPLTSYDPPVKDFFPLPQEITRGIKDKFSWLGELVAEYTDHFEMTCQDDETYDLLFDKTSRKLMAYSKQIFLEAATSLAPIGQIEEEMKKFCQGPVRVHKANTASKNSVDIRYCQYRDMVIVASTNMAEDSAHGFARVHLAYVSGKGWKEYLASIEKSNKSKIPASAL